MSDFGTAISPVSFWQPEYICPSAWVEHAPFAFWICEALRPRRFVELGTHYGYSYFAFCQAIDRLRLGTTAYAVDTWKGDEHAGFYDESVFRSVESRNREKYAAFSSLIRATFDDALDYFSDGSVDLLHIDGLHFYNDIMHDFTLWRQKLTEDAVVLFHDTNVRERESGVWKFFEKVAAQYPSFQFFHGYGLGVLIFGDRMPVALAPLLEASDETARHIRGAYAVLGGALMVRSTLAERQRDIEARNTERSQSLGDIDALKALTAATASERDQALAALAERQREIKAQDTARAQLLGEIDALKVLIATTTSERDQALAALAERQREIEAQDTARAQLLGEIDALKVLIATTTSERDQALVALAERQREIDALKTLIAATAGERDQALAAAGQATTERTAAVERAQANLTTLQEALAQAERARLAQAEREAQQGRASAATFEAEIVALQGSLTAARQVGRTAIAALQIRMTAPSIPDEPRGWRHAVMRFFGVWTNFQSGE